MSRMKFKIGDNVALKSNNLNIPYEPGEVFQVVRKVPQSKSKAGVTRWICPGFVEQRMLEKLVGEYFYVVEEV